MYEAALQVVRRLAHHGYKAYFAGGCVRDRVMGREPTDYDVATDAPPEKVLELFRRSRKVGQAFGVVMVGVQDIWVEVATFRTEWGYADHRHPDRVEFSDAQHDAQRRDFTINGLFQDPLTGEVIDYVGGREDLSRRIVRAIGEPRHRFEEDYLRMLRAVRFASRLGFEVESATAEAIRECAARLSGISRERIGQELRIMLEHASRAQAVHLIQGYGLDGPVLDEPRSDREPVAVGRLPAEADVPTALAAWAVDRHLQPRVAECGGELSAALERLKAVAIGRRWRDALVLSNDESEAMTDALLGVRQAAGWASLTMAHRKRMLARHDWPRVRMLLGAVTDQGMAQLDADAAVLMEQGVSPTPLVTGDDLIAAGFAPGPGFRKVLESVYDAQLEGRITATQEAIDLARTLM